jgi:hypothetical protein
VERIWAEHTRAEAVNEQNEGLKIQGTGLLDQTRHKSNERAPSMSCTAAARLFLLVLLILGALAAQTSEFRFSDSMIGFCELQLCAAQADMSLGTRHIGFGTVDEYCGWRLASGGPGLY